MNIYKVTRTDDWGYNNYDSFICIANNQAEAIEMPPDVEYESVIGWVRDIKKLKVELIGVADSYYLSPQVILASFNAG